MVSQAVVDISRETEENVCDFRLIYANIQRNMLELSDAFKHIHRENLHSAFGLV